MKPLLNLALCLVLAAAAFADPMVPYVTTSIGVGTMRRLIYTSVADSTALANPQTATAFDTTFTIPANAIRDPHTTFYIEVLGTYTTGATASAGWTLGLSLVGTGSGAIQATENLTCSSSLANRAFEFHANFQPRLVGAAGTVTAALHASVEQALAGINPSENVTFTVSDVACAFDSAKVITITAKSANSDASNSIKIKQMRVYVEQL